MPDLPDAVRPAVPSPAAVADGARAELASAPRVAALRATGLLDAAPSDVLERLTRTAARLLGVPIALVSLVDERRQWFAGLTGLTGWAAEARQTPLTHSFCKHVVTSGAPLMVADAAEHPLVRGNPAIADLGIRAYLGVPLPSAGGEILGALCAIDTAPHRWTPADLEALADLAAGVEAELRLREREAGFRLAIEATQEVIYTHDHATGHVVREGAVEAIYGVTPDAIAATSGGWLDRIVAEDRAEVAASWEAALARGTGTWSCEYRMQHPDGGRVVVQDRARVVTDADGRPLLVAGAIRDVTAQRVAEEALQASEAQWRRLLEIAYEGVCAVDDTGMITFANPRLEEMLGVPRHALSGTSYFDLLVPEDVPGAHERFAHRHAGIRDARELVLRRPDGTRLWVHKSASAMYHADGTFAGALFLFTDLSQRRAAEAERAAAEAALRQREAQLRLALDVAGMIVWERDLATDGIRDLATPPSDAAVRADALGTYAAFLEAVHPEDRERVARANAEAVARGGDFSVEYRVARADGTVRWQRTVGGVVQVPTASGEDGPPAARLVGVSLDVSEQRELEDRLRQAQKMEAVGQLAGGIAHDFNNLLTIISGNLEFLREDLGARGAGGGSAVAQDVDEIAHAAERARALVRQLLLFSRRQPVEARHVVLDEVVGQAERLLHRVIGEEIVLSTTLGAGAQRVRIDPGQLEQLLLNLAVNARDAMLTARHGHPGTGGTLEIGTDVVTLAATEARAWSGVGPGRWVRLTVRDTGHGMDASTQAHAFEPFFTTKAVGAGTGLGLATVFGIVRQVGGAVRVDSAPGRGTTFTLLLPTVDAADGAGDDGPAPPAADRAAGAGRTVLLVEDEGAVRVAARRMLERRGYAVLEARHGADALVLWRQHRARIAVVLTDVRMPELGGAGLLARLRAEAPGVPVVLMSGYVHDAEQLDEEPHTAFVAKPFAADVLADALHRVIAGAALLPAGDAAG